MSLQCVALQRLGLIAPRPLFMASAHEDPCSDPEGEFLSTQAVTSVYRLFGKQGLPIGTKYEVNRPAGHILRYYVRLGGHDVSSKTGYNISSSPMSTFVPRIAKTPQSINAEKYT